MTTIVGLVHHGIVTLGGDSAATNNADQQFIRANPKVFKRDAFVFGCTGSHRVVQLLRYSLDIPTPPKEDEVDLFERYMCTEFIDAVRACLKKGGYDKKEDSRCGGGNFLVGFHGQLFWIEEDYQVSIERTAYNAIGSGGEIALGAFHATQYVDISPRERLQLALEAASFHNRTTRPPFLFVSTEELEQHV